MKKYKIGVVERVIRNYWIEAENEENARFFCGEVTDMKELYAHLDEIIVIEEVN